MEHMLELQPGDAHDQAGCKAFINAYEVWYPAIARGVYGGVLVGQSLVAAQRSVELSYRVRSMQCTFLEGGKQHCSISYEARVVGSDECSGVTVVVKARQKRTLIFTASLQFIHSGSGVGSRVLREDPSPLPPQEDDNDEMNRPFLLHERVVPDTAGLRTPSLRKHVWVRSRQQFQTGDQRLHLAALALLSDSYVITTTAQAMGLQMQHRRVKQQVVEPRRGMNPPAKVSMMVTLNHVIYFQNHDFRADEWIFADMEVLWAGQGRAIVREHMYSPAGVLLATCVQEVSQFYLTHVEVMLTLFCKGVIRLEQSVESPRM